MVTNVNSKNKMSVRLSADFCQNIKNTKEKQSDSQSKQKPENLTQRAQTQHDDAEESPEPKERIKYIKTEPAERNPSPMPLDQNHCTFSIPKKSLKENPYDYRPLDLDSMKKNAYTFQKTKRSGSVQPVRTEAYNTNNTNQSHTQEEKSTISTNFEKMPSLLKQDTLRFKTKDIAQSISEKREQDLKTNPENYIRHSTEGDYRRYSDIEISVLERSRKYVKEHDGQQLRYMSAPKKRIIKQGYNLNDNIKKFEKHIDSLKRVNTNFGNQRWFYEKDWKLERLTTFDDSPLSKKEQKI